MVLRISLVKKKLFCNRYQLKAKWVTRKNQKKLFRMKAIGNDGENGQAVNGYVMLMTCEPSGAVTKYIPIAGFS